MKKNHISRFIDNLVPIWAILPLISCFVINMVVYSGTQLLCAKFEHYDLTSAFDKAIPFKPWWIYIYLISFLFWTVGYIVIARANRDDKTSFYRFVSADILSRLICAVFFIFLPTMNVRPAVVESNLSDMLMRMIYRLDEPTNLFPSIHCLVSWMCFVGVRKSDKVSVTYKIFALVMALAICASTQFTKQHYIIDMAGGIAIAEICYAISAHSEIYRYTKNVFERLYAHMQKGLERKGE